MMSVRASKLMRMPEVELQRMTNQLHESDFKTIRTDALYDLACENFQLYSTVAELYALHSPV